LAAEHDLSAFLEALVASVTDTIRRAQACIQACP
jgi:hypothetical protein